MSLEVYKHRNNNYFKTLYEKSIYNSQLPHYIDILYILYDLFKKNIEIKNIYKDNILRISNYEDLLIVLFKNNCNKSLLELKILTSISHNLYIVIKVFYKNHYEYYYNFMKVFDSRYSKLKNLFLKFKFYMYNTFHSKINTKIENFYIMYENYINELNKTYVNDFFHKRMQSLKIQTQIKGEKNERRCN